MNVTKLHIHTLKPVLLSLASFSVLCCGTAIDREVKQAPQAPAIKVGSEMDKRRVAAEHFRRAQNYFGNGEFGKAEDEARTALSLDPNHPVPHLLMGDVFFEQKEYEKALYEYELAKELDRTKGIPYVKRGKVYVELGRYREAQEAFETAVRLEPGVSGFHRDLGDLYKLMGLEDKAEREYKRAEVVLKSDSRYRVKKKVLPAESQEGRGFEQLDPKVGKVLELGDEFLKDGLLELAIEEYGIAVRLEPNSAITNQKLGDAYVRKGMLKEAITQYERVKDLKPDSPLGYLGLGVVHTRMFDIEETISSFERGLSVDPDFPPLHFELAIAYFQADRLDEAISELERTVKLDTINRQPKEILDKVRREKEAEEGFLRIQSGPFILKYDPRLDRSFIDSTLQSLQQAYEKLVIDMSYQPKRKIVVKLYPDIRQFRLAASTPEWFIAGVASAKDYKILLATPKKEININRFSEVITHELTHVFTNLITFSNHPAWIHEGIALWEASQWDLEKEKILKWAISEDKLFGLGELELPFTVMKNPKRINLAYAQSYAAVKFIVDKYGRDKLLEILYEFSEGRNFDEAARAVLKISMREFEEKWFDLIKETYR